MHEVKSTSLSAKSVSPDPSTEQILFLKGSFYDDVEDWMFGLDVDGQPGICGNLYYS
jgi:hypothetical protein